MRRAIALLCCVALGPLWAQVAEPVDHGAALARIEAARQRENAALDAKAAECYQRFAVNRCLADVQTQRIAAMNALRKQETALHDVQRRQQGIEEYQRLEQKALEKVDKDTQAEQDAQALAAQDRAQVQQEKRAEHGARAVSAASAPSANRELSAPGPKAQAQNRDAYAAKLAEAEKRRQTIAKRRADRTGKSLPAAPDSN